MENALHAQVLYATQGYDEAIHHSYGKSSDKQGLILIGHHETEREQILQYLLDHHVPVKLADATECCWQAMKAGDTRAWGEATRRCFEAQIEMYPAMQTKDMRAAIEEYRNLACGWKVTGCGGGYWILVSEKPIPNAIKVPPCHLN